MFLEELLLHKFFWYYLNVASIFLNWIWQLLIRCVRKVSHHLTLMSFFQLDNFYLLTNNRPVVHWFNVAFLFSYRKKASHFAVSSLLVMCVKQSSGFRTHLYYCVLFTDPNRYIFSYTDINLFNWQLYKFVHISRLH